MIVIECKATSLDFLLGKNWERKKKFKTFHLTHEKENNNVNFLLNIKKYLEETHFIPREAGNLLTYKAFARVKLKVIKLLK